MLSLEGRGWVIFRGNVVTALRLMEPESVHLVVTSPPY